MANEQEIFESLFGAIEEEEAKEGNDMTNNNSSSTWKQKLSSRKLWAAVAAAVLAVITAIFGDNLNAETVNMIKTGIYSLVAYVFGEGAVDVARIIAGKKTE
jgi:hypothetical protein